MLMSSFAATTLRERRRSLVGWSAGVTLVTLLLGSLWPTIRDMADFEALLQSYPQQLGELFNIAAMGTPAGYLGGEYFSLLAPLLFLTFGIGLGARLPAADEERGSLEVLLSLPVTRTRLLLEQAVALLAAVAVLTAAQLLAVLLTSLLFGMGISIGAALAAAVSMGLLAMLFGLIALVVGAATGRRATALAVASVLAVASYVLYVAAQFIESLRGWVRLSPFEHLVGSEPILRGLPPLASGVLALVALGVLAVSLPLFTRRDVAAA